MEGPTPPECPFSQKELFLIGSGNQSLAAELDTDHPPLTAPPWPMALASGLYLTV